MRYKHPDSNLPEMLQDDNKYLAATEAKIEALKLRVNNLEAENACLKAICQAIVDHGAVPCRILLNLNQIREMARAAIAKAGGEK